ncbi:MAG TPA: hypothetical protein VG056_09845 [Pirellulales bacterium]|jgi:hypothetical protein|nr:hypothetical protein [Pirellulales bacterium]
MTTLTPEQRQEIKVAGQQPVRVEDPETKTAYLIVREELFRRMREMVEVEKIDPKLFEFGDFTPLVT